MTEKKNQFRLKKNRDTSGDEPLVYRLVNLSSKESDYQKPGFTQNESSPDAKPPSQAAVSCCCDSVCACHSVSETVCTCNQVCTCDSVCACDSECSCVSYSGCSSYGHYWYPN
jgi:hypothetical protein